MKKELSNAAHTAQLIKIKLRSRFPGQKFSVTSETFTLGDGVRVTWTDGPTTEEIEKCTEKYCYGFFDNAENQYKVTNKIEGRSQVKYVTVFREMSREKESEIVTLLQNKLPCCKGKNRNDWVEKFNTSMLQLVWREFYDQSYYVPK